MIFDQPTAPGPRYRVRQVVFGIAAWRGFIAGVEVTRGQQHFLELPGGGLKKGETEEIGVQREFREETGLVVQPRARLGEVGQFYRSSGGDDFILKYGAFWAADIVGTCERTEPHHRLIWLRPEKAIAGLRHESMAWIVQKWLRWPERTRLRVPAASLLKPGPVRIVDARGDDARGLRP